jgi:ABC-type glutathione transport system ATPase component
MTSMVKRVDNVTFDMIERAKAGTFRGGVYSFGLKEGGWATSTTTATRRSSPPRCAHASSRSRTASSPATSRSPPRGDARAERRGPGDGRRGDDSVERLATSVERRRRGERPGIGRSLVARHPSLPTPRRDDPRRGETPALELTGVAKSFGPVRANRDASLEVRRGEIHALVGENGAGKSTLMRILSGMYAPDSGRVEVNGRDATGWSTAQAIAAGVGMVHQHFMLVPTLTVAENVVLGREPTRRGVFDRAAAVREVERVSRETGLEVSAERASRSCRWARRSAWRS